MSLIIGLSVIMSNIGARYIHLSINKKRERILAHPLMIYFYVFCMAFVGTHNPITSLILVTCYYLFMNY